jgi:hypothetical protein
LAFMVFNATVVFGPPGWWVAALLAVGFALWLNPISSAGRSQRLPE